MRFEILGPLRARVGDLHVPVTAARERVLLAMLLLKLDRPVPTDALVNAIWGEQPPAQAHNQVQHCVSKLRHLHANAGHAREVIVTEPGGYRLTSDGVHLDLHEFRQLVAAARASTERDPAGARNQYRAAIGLWRGPALAGIDSDYVHRSATALDEERIQATEECMGVELFLGGAGELVAELTELVGEHPYREGLHQALMLALFRAGRRADALAAYQNVRTLLATELGLEPGTALRQLQRRILADDATLLAGVRGWAGPPVNVPVPVPRQLPAPPQMFTGRATELAELDQLSDAATPVIVTAIDGMAGVGKTALAVHAAHRLAGRYPDGQLFIDLNGFTEGLPPLEPSEALDRILRTLGIPGEQIPADLAGRATMYRSRLAGQRLLILLDNAASDAQIAPLLPGTTGCLVMVTSRRRLIGLEATHTLSLEPVPPADAVALFTRIAGRGRNEAPELLEEAVRLCGWLPLATRIAAARLRSHPTWSVANLVERLRDQQQRLGELETGRRSVTAALDVSYQQLTAEQQRAYRMLGLHPGPDIEAHAAAALCRTTVAHAGRLLDQLHDAHLLQEPVPDRYRFHDLIRSHAAGRAETEPDQRTALTRMFNHYQHTAAVAMDTAFPHDRERASRIRPGDVPAYLPGSPSQATGWLDSELSNLLSVAQHAARLGWPGHTTQLSASLQGYLLARGRYREAEQLHHRALELTRATGDRHGELGALIGLGDTYRRQGRHDLATANLTQAHAIARATGDRDGELAALIGLGRCCRLQGRYREATRYLTQAQEIARATGNPNGEQEALIGLGHTHRQQGRHAEATSYLTQAQAIARATGNRNGELGALTGLGRVHLMQGRYDEAADRLSLALRIARTIGDRTLELGALTGLGHACRLRDDYVPAADYFRRALSVAREVGSRNWQFESFHGLGRVQHAAGHSDAALACHQQALQIATNLGQPEDQARAHDGLAHAHSALNQSEQARSHWQTALQILTHLGNDHSEDGEATTPAIRAHLADLDPDAPADGSVATDRVDPDRSPEEAVHMLRQNAGSGGGSVPPVEVGYRIDTS